MGNPILVYCPEGQYRPGILSERDKPALVFGMKRPPPRQIKYQDGVTPQAKYQKQATPFRSNTRAALSLGAKYPVGVALSNPVQIRYQAVLSLPGHYYHSRAKHQIGETHLRPKYQRLRTPFKSNTMSALSPSERNARIWLPH